MGSPKPLLPLGDRPAILRCLDALLEGGACNPVVVLGPGGDEIARLLADHPVTLTWNLSPETEMAGSVRAGLARLDPAATAVLVALADTPLVLPATIERMIATHLAQPENILLPTTGGRRGHPPLLPLPLLREIESVPTLRDVIRRDPGRVREIAVEDPGILADMDTPEDYEALRAAFQNPPSG